VTDLFEDEFGRPPAEDPEGGMEHRRAVRRRAQQRKAQQRRRNVITFVVMLAAMALLIGGAIVLIRPMLIADEAPEETITDYPGPGSGEVEVIINPGDSGGQIGQTLVDADVVATVPAFTQAYNNNQQATQIQAGTYTLQEEMAAVDAVQALLDPASRSDLTVTIPEGWRASQIYERIAARLDVPVSDVEESAAEVTSDSLPDEADGEIEGWLFASTYTIESDGTAEEILEQMVQRTEEVLEDREVDPQDWHELLVRASIVEAEVFTDEDRGRVATVLDNRIAGCSDDGFHGMDTTLAYALEKPAYEITQSEWGTDHPYNGRTRAGLPPTPIGSPSAESIDAVLDPPEGDWCYFVTVDPDSGETRFTADIDEHYQNQQEYRDWLADQGESTEGVEEDEG